MVSGPKRTASLSSFLGFTRSYRIRRRPMRGIAAAIDRNFRYRGTLRFLSAVIRRYDSEMGKIATSVLWRTRARLDLGLFSHAVLILLALVAAILGGPPAAASC